MFSVYPNPMKISRKPDEALWVVLLTSKYSLSLKLKISMAYFLPDIFWHKPWEPFITRSVHAFFYSKRYCFCVIGKRLKVFCVPVLHIYMLGNSFELPQWEDGDKKHQQYTGMFIWGLISKRCWHTKLGEMRISPRAVHL